MKNFIAPGSNFFILLSIICINFEIVHCQGTIRTSSGRVRGTQIQYGLKKVSQYLGIPFAEPPIGELRFNKPQTVSKRSETIVADTMPPACIQYLLYPFPWYDSKDGKSEDCLYLNIWVPQSLVNNIFNLKIPVMFWLYGGGFTVGSNRKRLYNGQALAAEGGIVVVTINYRMGAFGFFTSETEAAPGNVGIYDMLEALKWVNKNIEAFGGDPNKITISGQSAGSQSVSLLCVSPLAKGLFHRVIMESGSAAYLLAENNTASIANSQKLAEAVGCADENSNIFDNPEKVVSCVRSVNASVLAETLTSFHPTSARSFIPNYGNEILPQNARIALINGNFHNADVFIGNNLDEGAFQITTANPEVFGFFGEKNPNVNKSYGRKLLQDTFASFPDPEAVKNYYLGGVSDDNYDEIRRQVYTADGDYSLLCPTVYFAESYSRAGNKVYYYFFVHRPSTTPWANWMGVVHYEEVQFVFGLPLQASSSYTFGEVYLSKRMVDMWSSFVKNGNPGVLGWPLYSRKNPVYYELDTNLIPNQGRGPHKKNCDFFREYFGFA